MTNFGERIPGVCFAYVKIIANGYERFYPSSPNTYDCTSGSLYKE